ncbi:MAG: OsmC family protein [Alphaproteobacteria bacterium]
MMQRTATAEWRGGLKDGSGQMMLGSGAFQGAYSFGTRFENDKGTNPEELIGAAHAGCFSMALSAALGRAGFSPKRIRTKAIVTLDKTDAGFGITEIHLDTEGEVPEITSAQFQEHAEGAKRDCPVSKALAATKITLSAKLNQ